MILYSCYTIAYLLASVQCVVEHIVLHTFVFVDSVLLTEGSTVFPRDTLATINAVCHCLKEYQQFVSGKSVVR